MALPAVILATVLAILVVELTVWKLFHRKIGGLVFPKETDCSSFRCFTLSNLRVLAFLHTAALLAVTVIFLVTQW